MNETMPDWSSLSTSLKANFIRFAVAALRRGDPIDITNLAEAWKLFYGDYLLSYGGKLHSEGGNLLSGEDTDNLDLNSPQLYWPALESVPHRVVEDSNWKGIETFTPNQLRRLYPNIDPTTGYYKNNPHPNENTVLYNPNIFGGQDAVTLDGLHYMHDNPWYEDMYLDVVTEVVKDPNLLNRVLWELTWDTDPTGKTADARTNKILNTAQLDSNSKEVLFPAIDGYLRGQFAPDYMRHVEGGYADKYPSTGKLREAENNILSFMNSHILPEVTITANKKANGGNLFDGMSTKSLNLKNPATYHSVVDPFLIDFVIKEEGFLDKPTNIGDGKITIGSGLTNPKWIAKYRKNGNKWTTNDNLKAVEEELLTREAELRKIVPNWDDLPDSSKQGLLSYKYNYNFTKDNSPKMFEALRLGNLLEAARLMNATSKNPKFAAGLSQRRARELDLFLQDIVNGVGNQSWHEELPQDAILSRNPIIIEPERVNPIYVPVDINNNYVEATTKEVQDDTAGLKALNAFRNALSFEHTMQDLNLKLYLDQPIWDPLDVINNPLEFFKLKGNGGNLLALGTDDVEDPEEYSGWLSEFNVTPTSSGLYLQGYDEDGRKVYTVDPNQRMSHNFTADRLARWDEKFRNSLLPNTGEQWANIATGAIGLPMIATSPVTGALVGDLAFDLITHPIANTVGFGTGYLGNKADKALGITSTVNKVLPDKINLPEGTIGEFVGYPLGRFGKEIGTKLMNEDVKNAIVNNVGSTLGNSDKFKRFIEVAGQTGDINPLPYMKNYFLKDAWKPKEWPHLKETMNYIFTGKGNPRKAFFAKIPELYSEFGEGEFLIPNIGTDPTNPRTGYLRAVLFGEEPGTDLIKLGTADDVFIGEHAKTIAERGYDPKKVRVYTTGKSNDFPINDPKVIENAEKAFLDGNIISTSGEGSFKTKTGTYDAGGHRVFTVKDPTSSGYYPAFRQDFTDFSYLPYKQRWLKGSREPGIFTKIGLKAVDEATTPIIVRTEWEEARKPIGMSYVGSEYYNKLVKGLLKANPGILKEIGIGPSL